MNHGFPFQMTAGRQRCCPPKNDMPPQKECPPPIPPSVCPDVPPSMQKAHMENPLAGLLDKMDGETMLLLAFLWIASKEQCDKRLLMALGYIML